MTGNELVPVPAKPGPGQLRDSNGPMLSALCRPGAGRPPRAPAVADEDGAVARLFREAGREEDVLITSGGVSAGDLDLLPAEAAARAGFEILFHGVAVRPGKPIAVGRRGATLWFGLPGNPVSASVASTSSCGIALDCLEGAAEPGAVVRRARLTREIRTRGKRRDLPRRSPRVGGRRAARRAPEEPRQPRLRGALPRQRADPDSRRRRRLRRERSSTALARSMTRSARSRRSRPRCRTGGRRRATASSIAYTLWRQPSPELVVLAPGFWRVRLARENLFLGHHFLRRGYDVAALDFRGHGDSDGRYAFGASEHHDFQAVIEELVGAGRLYERFAVLGLSMGGSIAAQTLARSRTCPAGPSR